MIEYYRCIIGRYKEAPQDHVDVFVTAVGWLSIGVIVGLILAGIIAGITI